MHVPVGIGTLYIVSDVKIYKLSNGIHEEGVTVTKKNICITGTCTGWYRYTVYIVSDVEFYRLSNGILG